MTLTVAMPYFWGRFKKHRFFLSIYFSMHAVLLSFLLFALRLYPLKHPILPKPILLALIPFAMYLGIKLPTVMHNCVHGNLKKANDFIGECTAAFILLSFGIVCLHHTLHHRYPDTKKDPQNPNGHRFWSYALLNQFQGIGITRQAFFYFHGRSSANESLYQLNIGLHFLGLILRVALLIALLGPFFFWWYLPAFASFLFIFSHVNYYTHRRTSNGRAEIVNLNSKPLHRVINYLCDGIYFHKNHHLDPRAKDPRMPSRAR